jgi:hypothetical protein
MKTWLGLMFAMLAGALVLAGCKKSPGEAAGESDVNGYLCVKCKAKFYTGEGVFAEHCPGCKGFDLKPVVGYVCEKDQHVTVMPRGAGMARCEKCRDPLAAIKLPREPDLKAWGATKKSRAEVCKN